MSETEMTSKTGTDSTVQALQQEVQSLRSFVLGLVLILIVLSGAFNLFLLRQASLLNGQLALVLQENKRNVEEFSTQTGPALAAFWKSVNEFAKTNPDLVPLLSKYNFVGGPAGSAPANSPPAKKQ